jgi:hypothetical protein
MAKDESSEDIEWITVNGAHIPVKGGQSKDEAIRDHFGKEPPDNKEDVKARLDAIKSTKDRQKLIAQGKIKKEDMTQEELDQRKEHFKSRYGKHSFRTPESAPFYKGDK